MTKETALLEESYQTESLLQEMADMLSEKIQDRDLQMSLRIDEKLPSVLCGDVVKIKRILTILLTNAVLYTGRGRIIFSADGLWPMDGSFELRLSVADTGDGMKTEERQQYFESGTSELEQLTAEMSGKVEIDSVYGKGSLFTVTIPQIVKEKKTLERLKQEEREKAAKLKQQEIKIDNVQNLTQEMSSIEKVVSERENMQERKYFDHKIAMRYCGGNEELYQEVLLAYCESGKHYVKELPEYVKKQDWESYRVTVHAIKSTSLSIGSEMISELALQQEMLARELNGEAILDSWEYFFAEYQLALTEADGLLQQKDTGYIERKVVSEEAYKLLCTKLCETLDNFELDEAEKNYEQLCMLTTETLSDTAEDILQEIGQAIDNFQYTEAIDCVKRLME